MLKQELYKVLANKSVIFFATAVLLLNVIQLIYLDNRANLWSASGYTEAWRDIEELLQNETTDGTVVQDWLDERSMTVTLAIASRDDEAKNAAAVYEDNVYVELELLSKIQAEVDFALGYNDYLANIDEMARRYEMIAVFRSLTDMHTEKL